jgi:hypothetical protein
LWLPVAPFVGFTLAETVFDLGAEGAWELWKAALLGALLMAPFTVGAYLGLRSVLKGFRGGWVGFAAKPRPGGAGDRYADRGVLHRLTWTWVSACRSLPRMVR